MHRLLRWALFFALSLPGLASAQPFETLDYVYGISSIDYAFWMFQRDDPYNTRQRVDLQDEGIYGVSVAVDILTNRVYVRVQAQEIVWCADASTLVFDPEPGGDLPTCSFYTPGGNGAITIDPIRRVLYSDGGGPETDNCSDPNSNLEQDGQILAFSLDAANRGEMIDTVSDPGGGHWATDGNHLVFDPTDRVVWSSSSEWTDGFHPRRLPVGNVNMRGGEFGELEVTGLPTIMPGSSMGVDPDHRRIYLVPWNPPTHPDPVGTTVADHPEALYVHVYDMDSFAEVDILDEARPPAEWDDNTHCGFNTDFKVFYDRVGGWLYETNFYEFRAMFYDLAGNVYETPSETECPGTEFTGTCILDLYGFDGPLPLEFFELDSDGDGIPDPVELGATEITLDPTLNDLDPRQHTDPDLTDSDEDGLDDGVEDADHNGRVDAGETNPSDPTDAPGGDYDEDGVPNDTDNCRAVANPGQEDEDGDGRGDECDGEDRDDDGFPDDIDNCDCLPNPAQGIDDCGPNDQDADGAEDSVDNCPCVPNEDQADDDSDGFGNACSSDSDGDTVPDAEDNCPEVANPDQGDNCDQDGGLGDACSPNADGDEYADACDNCPDDSNDDQADSCILDHDDDGLGDACSPDADGDGVFDACDNCPADPNPDQTDLDGDGQGAACTEPPSSCACATPGLPAGRDRLVGLAGLGLLAIVAIRRRRAR